MGKHKELENIFLNELVLEEERAYRAKRIIEHQQKLIEDLERILTEKEKQTQQETKVCQTEILYMTDIASSTHSILPATSKSTNSVHSTVDITTNENTKSERSITSTERVESSGSENNEMKNVRDETTNEKVDSVECLVGLLNPSVCQNPTATTSVAYANYPSRPRTSHSIVQITNSNQILRKFDRIQRRLANIQEVISNTGNNISPTNSQEAVIQRNAPEQSEESATQEMLAQLNKMGMKLKVAINELNWKIEGNRRFRDQRSRQRWKIARQYFTAEQAYFLLTSEPEDSLS